MTTLNYMGVMNSIRREPEIVFRGLRSFLKQNPRPAKILFIDQNVTPMTLPDDLKNLPELTHMHKQVPSVGLARNLVPDNPGVDWIIFCDDDGFLADEYVEKLVMILSKNSQLGLVAGPYVNETDGRYYSVRHEIGGSLDGLIGSKLLLGSNFAIRPQIFNQIGRYDSRFGPGSFWPSSDETDLCWRALEAQVPMQYSPDIRVFHPPAHTADTRLAIQKAFRYGRGKGALTAKWIIERKSRLGWWELIEMNVVPVINMIRGLLRGEPRQVPIQLATLAGRYRGFCEFILNKGRP